MALFRKAIAADARLDPVVAGWSAAQFGIEACFPDYAPQRKSDVSDLRQSFNGRTRKHPGSARRCIRATFPGPEISLV
jgi:hypothetical protein